jgi:hypothetical protein
MSLQKIINCSEAIVVDRRQMVGLQYTKNQMVRITESPSVNPWRFSVTVPNMSYYTARGVLEDIDRQDKTVSETVNFGVGTTMNWMFRYQGDLTAVERATVSFVSWVGNQMTVNVSGITGASKKVFAKGDMIQIIGYPHPITSHFDVTRGSATTVTFTVHRPNMLQATVPVGTKFNWGNDCLFKLICVNAPTYKFVPGATKYQNGTLVNNAMIEWSDAFSLYEYIV